jgi:hypothetical protein
MKNLLLNDLHDVSGGSPTVFDGGPNGGGGIPDGKQLGGGSNGYVMYTPGPRTDTSQTHTSQQNYAIQMQTGPASTAKDGGNVKLWGW